MMLKEHRQLTAAILDFESHMVSVLERTCMCVYNVLYVDRKIFGWMEYQGDSTGLQIDIPSCSHEWAVAATASSSVS